jgi:archaellum biogenesis ATPase FlaH
MIAENRQSVNNLREEYERQLSLPEIQSGLKRGDYVANPFEWWSEVTQQFPNKTFKVYRPSGSWLMSVDQLRTHLRDQERKQTEAENQKKRDEAAKAKRQATQKRMTTGSTIAPELADQIRDVEWEIQNAEDDGKYHLIPRLTAKLDQLQEELDYRIERDALRQERRKAGLSVLGMLPLSQRQATNKHPFVGVSLRLFPGTLTMLWANKGEGKSSAMLQTAIELAVSGKRVLYIQTEETSDQTANAISQWHNLNPGHQSLIDNNLIVVDWQEWENDLDEFTDGKPFDLATADTIRDLTEAITVDNLDVVMIDTISSAFPSEDSDMLNDRLAKRITKSLLNVIANTGVTILFAHHSGRNGDHYYGSHTWGAKSQTVLALSYSKSTKRITVKEQHQRYAQEKQVTVYERVGELLVSPIGNRVSNNGADLDRETAILDYMTEVGKPIGATGIADALGLDKKQVERVLNRLAGRVVRNLGGRKGWELI